MLDYLDAIPLRYIVLFSKVLNCMGILTYLIRLPILIKHLKGNDKEELLLDVTDSTGKRKITLSEKLISKMIT